MIKKHKPKKKKNHSFTLLFSSKIILKVFSQITQFRIAFTLQYFLKTEANNVKKEEKLRKVYTLVIGPKKRFISVLSIMYFANVTDERIKGCNACSLVQLLGSLLLQIPLLFLSYVIHLVSTLTAECRFA